MSNLQSIFGQYGLETQAALQNMAMQQAALQYQCTSASSYTLGTSYFPTQPLTMQAKPKERTMFQEVVNDVKTFVREHRGVIYFVAIAILIDHFIFKGAFKERLQAMAGKIVNKVEAKLD